MPLLDSIGPNPKTVRMLMAERGITGIPVQTIDLRGGENCRPPYLAKNPTGQCPALQPDDGSYPTEITAICEYLDETVPGPSLIGTTPGKRTETRMWTRRIDLAIIEPMVGGFRYAEGPKFFSPLMRYLPQAAGDLNTLVKEKLAWSNDLIADRPFICGDRLTLAEIFLFAFLQFAATVRQPLDPANANLTAWYQRMAGRPTAGA